jgi:hypothetical protein
MRRTGKGPAEVNDILPASSAELKTFDKWNRARIVSEGNMREHWLNAARVLVDERDGETRCGLSYPDGRYTDHG